MSNKEIFSNTLKTLGLVDVKECKNFLHNFNNQIYWHMPAGVDFSKIHPDSRNLNNLYVFTQQYPDKFIYDFMVNFRETKFYSLGDLNLTINDIHELYLIDSIKQSFERRLKQAIANRVSTENLRVEYDNNYKGIKHLKGMSFEEYSTWIINNEISELLGRIFLMNLGISRTNIFDTYRRYVLCLFVDKKYFQDTFIDGLGMSVKEL